MRRSNIHNVVSGLDRTTKTDSSGNFSFTNVPYNPYHLTVTAPGFASQAQDVDVRSAVPVNCENQPDAGASNRVGNR